MLFTEDSNINGFNDAIARQVLCNKWTFISFTYNSASEVCITYINGRKAGYSTNVPTLFSCRELLLGGDPFQPSYHGYVSGLMIYNSVKSEEEIHQLYTSFCAEDGFMGDQETFWK